MPDREWNAEQLLETSGDYWKSCVLHAAVKLDLFTILDDGRLSTEEILRKLEADPRGIGMLLTTLVVMSLLKKSGNGYSNTAASSRFLSRNSSSYIGRMIMHQHNLMDSWSKLDQAAKSGKPVRKRASSSKDERLRRDFLVGMHNNAMLTAPRLVPEIDLSNKRRFLDLGGGPGTYAIYFCRQNPELKATIFDLPATKPFAEETVKKYGMEDRIEFAGGDYLIDDIPGSYDVAWLSHILHGEGPEECKRIVRKAVSALEPKGLIMVHDFILNNSMDGPVFPALFSLNMLLGTASGQAYSQAQITDMLASAGAVDISRMPLAGQHGSGVIRGIKR
jgi:predicted O-methyltransferase YrrM